MAHNIENEILNKLPILIISSEIFEFQKSEKMFPTELPKSLESAPFC